MAEIRDIVFIQLLVFWTLLTIFSNYFDIHLTNMDITDLKQQQTENQDQPFYKTMMTNIFDYADNIPVIEWFTPLLRILLFQYNDQIHWIVSALLDLVAVLSILIVYGLARQG